MLPTIHTIADSILIRKSLKWKDCYNAENEPIDINSIYNNLNKVIDEALNKVFYKKNKQKKTCHFLCNLFNLKESLDINPWRIPCNLNKQEFQIFLQDTDFYLMLSSILIKVRRRFKGFISENKVPSCIKILPIFTSNPKKVKQLYSQLNLSSWRSLIESYSIQNRYLKQLGVVEKLIELMPESTTLSYPINVLNDIFRSLPVSSSDEHILIHNLDDTHKLLMRLCENENNQDNWIEYRQLLTEPMVLGYSSNELCELYLTSLKQHVNITANTIKTEIAFIKNQSSRGELLLKNKTIKSNNGINILKQLQLEIEKLTPSTSQTQFLEWNHNPKDFVKEIQQIISKGYITIKGNNDMRPIVEVISNFVKVRKQNNTGNSSYSSLLTYFNKAKVGDL